MIRWNSKAILTASATLALAVGALVYAGDRQVPHAALIPALAVAPALAAVESSRRMIVNRIPTRRAGLASA